MKTLKITLVLIFSGLLFVSVAQDQRNILTSKFKSGRLAEKIVSASEWIPGSAYDINWEAIPSGMKKAYVDAAEKNYRKEVPAISATLTMEYSINGNRTNFQDVWNERRIRLVNAVVAEKIENKGRFMSDIVDLIWAICEESWWGVPAHHYQYKQVGLPDVKADYVDLFAAETGVLLAWTYYHLNDELTEVTPVIIKRILDEIDERIITPCLTAKDYHWMGYQGQDLNNWTPWICSNWLACALICEQDETKKAEAIGKIMLLLDRFLNPYNADGGCDEGSSYWGRAGASLFDCLELLELCSEGYINVWDEPLVKNIGTYIYKVHVNDDYYVNFADASARTNPDPAVVFRFGKKINDTQMMEFGSWLAKDQKLGEGAVSKRMGRLLPILSTVNEIHEAKASQPEIPYSWFPDLEVATCKEEEGSKGFFVAVKGGHNKESHNHNDVGNFIVYLDGKPLLIDVGVETYTQKTFSSKRYEIWTMQSQFHNLPTINGFMQSPGRKFKAENSNFKSLKSKYVFSLDIKGAYPEGAGVNKWFRSVELSKRGSGITITEDFDLNKSLEPIVHNFMTDIKPDVKPNSVILYTDNSKASKAEFKIPAGLKISVEECDSSDGRLVKVWGKEVYRIQLTSAKPLQKGKTKFVLKRAND